jgi:hypothetical protein
MSYFDQLVFTVLQFLYLIKSWWMIYRPVDRSAKGYLDKSNQSSTEPFEN